MPRRLASTPLAVQPARRVSDNLPNGKVDATFRRRTSARLTSVGRAAFDQHVVALQEIVAKAGASILPR
jgi:hypothetical protein